MASFDVSKLSFEEKQKLKDVITDLRKKHELFTRGDTFKVGDIVSWKPGLRNRRYPRPGTAGIVTRIFPVPVKDASKTEAGSPYFNEDLDVSIGVIDGDGDFVEFTYDSKRLQIIQPGELLGKQVGIICDGCKAEEFTGVRFRCTVCDNFDLCPECQAKGAEPADHKHDHKMIPIEACTEAVLKDRLETFMQTTCFVPGDIVRWKPGMKNKRLPEMDQFAVVVEVLPVPVTDEDKSVSGSYFMEPLDLKLGMVDSDGDFIIFHYDSRRFMKAM